MRMCVVILKGERGMQFSLKHLTVEHFLPRSIQGGDGEGREEVSEGQIGGQDLMTDGSGAEGS